jgi:hypothetical protein
MAKLRTDAEEFGEEYSKRVKELTARKKLLGRMICPRWTGRT